ncbi:MAG: FliH/SctL family protein [Lawsonibacter sp.]|nr:FliH/SctL family protein [Lawsonibacter sp.]
MPNIRKHFLNPATSEFVFPNAADLLVEEPLSPRPSHQRMDSLIQPDQADPTAPIDYAKIQAEAILASAHQQADEIRDAARQSVDAELNVLRKDAQAKGYQLGFTEGMADAQARAKQQLEQQASALENEIKEFLETAAHTRDQVLEQAKEELKDLSLAIAEKVIRISLKSSGDILLRMIESATEKHKRCEWAYIYLAGCDLKSLTYTMPELTAALSHLSERVRIIPMADDESGTCIIELPDEIIDASVSTQLSTMKELLSNTGTDRDDG